MKDGFSKRDFIRTLSFATAALCVLLAFMVSIWRERNSYRRQLETVYQRSLQDAVDLISGIALSLDKELHTAGERQASLLASTLWKDAGEAKAALSSLPVGQLELGGAYRFLSQVGDYALRASREGAAAASYRETLQQLRDYASALESQLGDIQSRVAFGQLSLIDSAADAARAGEDAAYGPDAASSAPEDESGFAGIEESFAGYPTLIYDGPFSDHLLERTPRLTAGRPTVSREDARAVAAACALTEARLLADGEDERSALPLYTFKTGQTVVGVTRDGGFPCYMVDGRAIGEGSAVDPDAARQTAVRYLAYLGLPALKETYYETANNILTINYAHYQQGTVCYPDLIKVGVALDNGQVVFFDARGYIMNHHERTLPAFTVSAGKAAEALNPALEVLSVRPALIPTPGGDEVLCHEFLAVGAGGEEYLLYVNGQTGEEEELLKLLRTADGVLTR